MHTSPATVDDDGPADRTTNAHCPADIPGPTGHGSFAPPGPPRVPESVAVLGVMRDHGVSKQYARERQPESRDIPVPATEGLSDRLVCHRREPLGVGGGASRALVYAVWLPRVRRMRTKRTACGQIDRWTIVWIANRDCLQAYLHRPEAREATRGSLCTWHTEVRTCDGDVLHHHHHHHHHCPAPLALQRRPARPPTPQLQVLAYQAHIRTQRARDALLAGSRSARPSPPCPTLSPGRRFRRRWLDLPRLRGTRESGVGRRASGVRRRRVLTSLWCVGM
ncbi:hypothetical protein OH76DRAFT_1196105 [Lentinus brumalis]|uniref:Uncharacterized protein n=1 Tax=Lentinus brumalis TaxID=2498619 RepID=A0A371CTB3_9APHY|nr:hypothetical protein OH76DRAFT_1196105 [Polyporus brumalis]